MRSAGILPAPENAAGTAALHKNPTAREVAMRFRKTLTFLIVATALPFAQPAGARQRNLAPASRSAFCSGGVPTAGRRSETAATVANASACAAILPALPAGVKQNSRPFIQDQVQAMVRDGFGDESGAKLIEQRGIDFAPSEDFMQTLKAAGASEAFLKALGAAQVPSHRVAIREPVPSPQQQMSASIGFYPVDMFVCG